MRLDDLQEQERLKISRVPLIRYIQGDSKIFDESTSRTATPRKIKRDKPKNPESEVLKHRNPTVVTPLVQNIAKALFDRTLSVAGQLEKDLEEDILDELDDNIFHHTDPDDIEWLAPSIVEGYYDSVKLDDVIYSVSSLFTDKLSS